MSQGPGRANQAAENQPPDALVADPQHQCRFLNAVGQAAIAFAQGSVFSRVHGFWFCGSATRDHHPLQQHQSPWKRKSEQLLTERVRLPMQLEFLANYSTLHLDSGHCKQRKCYLRLLNLDQRDWSKNHDQDYLATRQSSWTCSSTQTPQDRGLVQVKPSNSLA